ncbi:LysR family transcriptional regulator [Mailhella massiliensis]|uniref:LysR family transcriptional regulator n=1 Tax=Mailhella massiliensis TaxID=1903261 RepID=UPI00097D529D|nr:LysR family transcriptional regulator [Mailhella massiliensis]
MKIAHLETFAKVAETGSFTRAAHDLFTTQPTVTNHIQMLEQELGYQLLIRQKNNVRLTEHGKNIYHKVEEIFRLIESIKNANAKNNTLSGILNIAASSVMGSNYLPHILQKVFSDYPDVNIQLRFGNSHSIASWVDEGFVDMGFAPFSSGFPRLVFTPLLVEPCVLLTSRKRYDHYRKLLEEGTCTSGDFVIREKGTKLYEVSMSYLKKQPFYNENRPPHILYNIESIKNFIIEGAGIAILPRCCIEKCLQLDLVAVLPSSLPVGNITYCMIERQNENYNALFRKFRSILLEEQEAPAKNTSAK